MYKSEQCCEAKAAGAASFEAELELTFGRPEPLFMAAPAPAGSFKKTKKPSLALVICKQLLNMKSVQFKETI